MQAEHSLSMNKKQFLFKASEPSTSMYLPQSTTLARLTDNDCLINDSLWHARLINIIVTTEICDVLLQPSVAMHYTIITKHANIPAGSVLLFSQYQNHHKFKNPATSIYYQGI